MISRIGIWSFIELRTGTMKWVTLIAAISIHLCECLFYLYLFFALVLPFCVTIMSKIKSNNRNPRSASGPATGHYTQVIIVLEPFLWCCLGRNWKAFWLRFKLSNYDNSLQVVWAETDKLGCANVYFNVRQNSFFLVTFQSKYSWCSKLYSKNVETTTFAQEASQPSFPYTNLVVCNYAVAGNLISGSMYSQVVKLTFSITLLRCSIRPPKPYSASSSLSGNCLLLMPLLYNLRGLLVSSCMNCPRRWLFLLLN